MNMRGQGRELAKWPSNRKNSSRNAGILEWWNDGRMGQRQKLGPDLLILLPNIPVFHYSIIPVELVENPELS
jgi:hypothetical protein